MGLDDIDAAAMNARAELLVQLFEAVDARKDPRVLAVLEEFRALVDDLEVATRTGRYLDAAHFCEELADVFRGREMTLTAERFDARAKSYRYESRIRARAKTRRDRRREGR